MPPEPPGQSPFASANSSGAETPFSDRPESPRLGILHLMVLTSLVAAYSVVNRSHAIPHRTESLRPDAGPMGVAVGTLYSIGGGAVLEGTLSPTGDVGDTAEIVQTGVLTSQDGSGPGVLASFIVGEDGRILGVFSSGLTQDLGQIRLAQFGFVSRLEYVGGNLFTHRRGHRGRDRADHFRWGGELHGGHGNDSIDRPSQRFRRLAVGV